MEISDNSVMTSILDALDRYRSEAARRLDGDHAQTAMVWLMTALHPELLPPGATRLSTDIARQLMAESPTRGFAWRPGDLNEGVEELKRQVRKAIKDSRDATSAVVSVSTVNNYTSQLGKFVEWCQSAGLGVKDVPPEADAKPKEVTRAQAVILGRVKRELRCPGLAALRADPYSYRPWTERDRAEIKRLEGLADAYLMKASEARMDAEILRERVRHLVGLERLRITGDIGRLSRTIRCAEAMAGKMRERAGAARDKWEATRWTADQMDEWDRIQRFGLTDLARGRKGKGAVSESTMDATRDALGKFLGFLVNVKYPADCPEPRLQRDFHPDEMETICQNETFLRSFCDWMTQRHALHREDQDYVTKTPELVMDRVGWTVARYWIPAKRRAVALFAKFLMEEGELTSRCSMDGLRSAVECEAWLTRFEAFLISKDVSRSDAAYTVSLVRRAGRLRPATFEAEVWGHHLPDSTKASEVSRDLVAAYRVIENHILPGGEGNELPVDPNRPTIPEIILDVAQPLWRGAKMLLNSETARQKYLGAKTAMTTAASMARDALILHLMMYLPLRMKNWRMARIDKHLVRSADRDDRTTKYTFCYQKKETKNKRTIIAELPRHLWGLLDEYLGYSEFRGRGIRDILVSARATGTNLQAADLDLRRSKSSPYLFPAIGGGRIAANSFEVNLADWVASSPNPRVASFRFTPHTCRHIVACTHLDATKGGSWSNLAMVAELLADNAGTVATYYAVLNTTSAVTEGAARVDTLLSKAISDRQPESTGFLPEEALRAITRASDALLREHASMPDSELSAITGRTGGQLRAFREAVAVELRSRERVPQRTDSDAKMQRGPVKRDRAA